MIIPYRADVEVARRPFGTSLVAALCFAGLAYTATLDEASLQEFFYAWGYVPFDPSLPALLTHMFLHAGGLHLIGNLLFLAIFGPAIEDRFGTPLYLILYVLFGISGALAQSQFAPGAMSDIPMVGASGAISGIIGAFLVLYPRDGVKTIVMVMIRPLVVTLPSFIVLGLWFAEQLLFSFYLESTNVAVMAHIGGFACGATAAWFSTRSGRAATGHRLMPELVSREDLGLLLAAEDPKASYEVMKRASDSNHHDEAFQYGLALAALKAGAPEEARAKAASLFEDARGLSHARRLDLRLLLESLGSGDDSADTLFDLGEGLFRAKQPEKAYPLFSRFLAEHSSHPKRRAAMVRLADLLINALGRPEEARPYLAEVAAGDPRNAFVQEAQYLLKRIPPSP